MDWIFYTFFVKFVVEISFLTKPTFPKSCESFNESHFQAKITTFYYWFYWFWISSTNGFTGFELVYRLIAISLFKLELSIFVNHMNAWLWRTRREVASRLLSKRCTCSRHLWTYEYLSISGYYVSMTSLPLWEG